MSEDPADFIERYRAMESEQDPAKKRRLKQELRAAAERYKAAMTVDLVERTRARRGDAVADAVLQALRAVPNPRPRGNVATRVATRVLNHVKGWKK